ncbi:ABC transporter permease [Marinobacter persicus]|jgi:ABC-2 type transport system permease protein|uniref:ABC-2 type transport system permease protein n=1 Tax=Marinobacter persicus TaxID=930118 RepID=A0A2S6G4G3_9GAMM|nr:ABC transporter permease [Marinobacter persicus]KXS54758.1 MAG: antibiotic transport system permease protein [Marinobacter sp. T13-3]PPK50589.1 ABC-2 type transport system permease protein [Marinobacter persicus]PPK53864.1 ABC-2 type transport system permease protein [Marinobacter persicus]PPK57100.1 ABC-2 type transport system permease protein [Marinobacter persicus]
MNAVRLSLIRLWALLGKEFRQMLRDPRMRFFIIVPPLVQLVIFGYAATFDVRVADVAVVDEANIAASRELIDAVAATGHFRLTHVGDMDAAEHLLERSDVRAILRFPWDFDGTGQLQLIGDGSDSNSAQLVMGQLSATLRDHLLQNRQPPLELITRAWFNQNLEDRYYFVPGIMANVVLIATMILVAMTVVREREHGTLERLMVTPLAKLEFIVGKLIPVALIGLFDVILITLVAVYLFDVPFRGSFMALVAGTMLYLMSTLGMGLLISSYASTQQQAMLTAFFFLMPMVILSGFAFPIRNMPEWIQYVTYLDPLRYYLVVVRDLFLKGGGLASHPFQFGMMGLLGSSALGLSLFRLR